MQWTGCETVEQIPGKVSGVPVLRGSRVQAETVVQSHDLGETAEEIAYSYDLSLQDVKSVLRFADRHVTSATRQ